MGKSEQRAMEGREMKGGERERERVESREFDFNTA